MKLLITTITFLTNLNGVNVIHNLIKNDTYQYNLSNLLMNHDWSSTDISKNDININLYYGNNWDIFTVYGQIAYSLDRKYNLNERYAFNETDSWFMTELEKDTINPENILKLKILNSTDNWTKNNIVKQITTNTIFSNYAFGNIVKRTDNEVYSLNLEASINDKDGGWDPNGKLDFSVNIASIDSKKPVTVPNDGILDSNGKEISFDSANNAFDGSAKNSSNNGQQKITPIKTVSVPLNSISKEFIDLDVDNKYIKNIVFNGLQAKCSVKYTYQSQDDKTKSSKNLNKAFELNDSDLHNISEESSIESNWQTFGKGIDSFTGDIPEKFHFGQHADTYGFAAKYFDPNSNSIEWKFATAGCGTSSYSYDFYISYSFTSVQIQLNNNIWDNLNNEN